MTVPRRRPKPKRKIALAFPNTMVIAGNMLHGIVDYAHARGGWRFTRIPEQLYPSSEWLTHWQGDGALAALAMPEELHMARALPFPIVNLLGYRSDDRIPLAALDHRAIGRLQAEHLLARRFRRLAYYGVSDLWYCGERLEGFEAALAGSDVKLAVWLVPSCLRPPRRWTDQQAELERRLRELVPPFAVAASTDLRAEMVMEACAALGLRIPEDVAVIGVDNDPTVAPLTVPPLTSVARNDRELGYRAAELLDGLMNGRAPKRTHILVPPCGIVTRRSTETLAIDDPELDALVCLIRDHIDEPFGVEFLLARTPHSRRQIERLVRLAAGCSPYRLINRLRVEHACRLLSDREPRSLTRISARCGFADLRRFRLVFRRHMGSSPAAFRRQAHACGCAGDPAPASRHFRVRHRRVNGSIL